MTPVCTFAVDDHAAPDDEPSAEVAVVQRCQQCRGADVVVTHVCRRVGEVETETDHGRLVADRIDPGDCPRGDVRVGEITPLVARLWVEVVGSTRMCARMEPIDHPDFVAVFDELVDDE